MTDWLANNKEINDYAVSHTQPESNLLQVMQSDIENTPGANMLSGRLLGQLLRLLIYISQAKKVLDIGTFTGYSALMMAEALPPDGKVLTLESSEPTLAKAKAYFAESACGHKIITQCGNALEIIPTLEDDFDLIFIDADKNRIMEYYELALTKLRVGGVMVIDDVLWRGEVVLDNPSDKRAKIMQQLNHFIVSDNRVENLLLPIRHGVNIVLKRS
jgi:caffeoyl-CoA O-methyltransferase